MADSNVRGDYKPSKYKKINRPNSSDHTFKKRPPQKFETNKTTIYVSTKCNTKALLEKCSKLILDDNESELTLYCMGAAIQRGILLALQVCDKHPTFESHVKTLTTELTDDLEPATDEADYEIQKRYNSALQIKLIRKDLLQPPEQSESSK